MQGVPSVEGTLFFVYAEKVPANFAEEKEK